MSVGAAAPSLRLGARRRRRASGAASTPALGRLDAKLAALTVFLSPMNYFRLETVYLTAADVAACATLLVMLYQRTLPRAPFGPATPIWLAGVLLLGAGLTLGSLAGGDMTDLAVTLGQYSFSLLLLPFILAGRSYREAVALLKVLVAAILVVMVYGMYLMHFADSPDIRLVSGSGRMRSLVERSNECAALGSIALVLLLNLALLGEVRRPALLLGIPIILYGITLTGSNTGILLLAIGVAATVLGSASLRMIAAFGGTACVFVAAVVVAGDLFLPEIFRERVLAAIVDGDLTRAGTIEGRLYLMREAIEISRDTLLIGLGAEQYRAVSEHGAPVHNTYLLLLAEGGLLSLAGLILLLLAGVFVAWSALDRDGARLQALVTVTIIVIFAFMLNTFAHFYARFLNVPVILALGLASACRAADFRRPE